jgi:hypothetical protein
MTPLPSSSSLVQANSVQSQFAALSNDRDRFRNEQAHAERERLNAERQLQQLKSTQRSLQDGTRSAQGELGSLTQKRTYLEQEKARLGRVLGCERKALEGCARHVNSMSEEEDKKKKLYCTEMEPLNDGLARQLAWEYGHSVRKYLSVECLEEVVLNDNKFHDPNAVTADINVFGNALKESLDLMQEEKDKSEHEDECYHRCKVNLAELRARAQQQTKDVDCCWVEKENIWGQQDFSTGNQCDEDTNPQDHHMELFYGSQQDEMSIDNENETTDAMMQAQCVVVGA